MKIYFCDKQKLISMIENQHARFHKYAENLSLLVKLIIVMNVIRMMKKIFFVINDENLSM